MLLATPEMGWGEPFPSRMRYSHSPARNIEPRRFCSRYLASHAIARFGGIVGYRSFQRSLRYLTMGTPVARPALDGRSRYS
jgi:hypothetical protein